MIYHLSRRVPIFEYFWEGYTPILRMKKPGIPSIGDVIYIRERMANEELGERRVVGVVTSVVHQGKGNYEILLKPETLCRSLPAEVIMEGEMDA